MLNSGDILDEKYEVIKVLGKGGMGTVYLCKNIRLGNLWAIKEVMQNAKHIDTLTEANILRDLSHVGIRRIVDIFYENNNLYMVQDYVDGQTLNEYVRANGRIQTESICRITSDLCDIVGYLHNQNPAIIYRDIKPSNIMITSAGKIILIDFGISKIYKDDRVRDPVCAGSNGYAAPEQYGLGKCCTQTDIYGIGMLIYFMLKGRNPSTGVEPLLDESYEENIDDSFKAIVQKCVQIDIENRYISVEVLNKEILEVLKKPKYEETVVFSDYNINTNVLDKKVNTKILNKGIFKKTVTGFLFFIVAILASAYMLYINKKEGIDMNTADRLQIVTPIAGSSIMEQDIPVMKKTTKTITQDSTISEKTSPLAKGKEKKKKEKN